MNEYRRQSLKYNNHQSCCPWRLKSNGLNIEGLCKNSHCPAYDQMVIINLGFGEFDFARIILERHNQCPICKNKISPIKYALHNCRWWYVNHYSTCTFPLNTVNDTYVLNNLKCEYKIMETMPLPKNYRICKDSEEIACPICLMDIENDNERIHLPCSHTFHRSCIYGWLQSNELMAHTCPMCREHIVEIY
ncbi:unnamed protein product [Rotaria sordida]|uniref:RING-type domain-containing protein n=1 Tax=Rotaria sordida TaxID=392033 RepID=A0A815FL47_9BILA|nr:unnamed protein product [Rotaria sordida]CAF1046109.1 unnamed protein product [Rotaria sordida]CAF1087523.1 unnamed protein product [Rotaria sordida]CAF1131785.1 unnamed protein product [Rotaria sordida]CAF1330290.1 unnamed protein product [Rotaria sordida]